MREGKTIPVGTETDGVLCTNRRGKLTALLKEE